VTLADRLFVYGTLRPDHAPSEIADAVRGLKPIGSGKIHGKLYHLGAYPGVILDDRATETVEGEVFALPDAETLARLDEYEEYHPQEPEKSLFKRLKTTVTLQNGSRETCWVYVYNRELPRKTA
jgi:gamma-glutamylcyclotransferase (GGCT)/AIG2-like uncharacterized protein YtfP